MEKKFRKLYGSERELIVSICRLSPDKAMDIIVKRYNNAIPMSGKWSKHSCLIDFYFLDAEKIREVKSLIESGYFEQFRPDDEGVAIRLGSHYKNYIEMEKDYDKKHKGGDVMFQKLFGIRREIVEAIYSMTNEDAKCYLRKLAKEREMAEGYDYNNSTLSESQRDNYFVITFIGDEVNSLVEEGFLDITKNTFNGILQLTITQKCRDYFEMEKEYERTMEAKSVTLIAPYNSGNIAMSGRDINEIAQTINTSSNQDKILELLEKIKQSLAQLDNVELKESIKDDLDISIEQMKADIPNVSRLKRAWERLKDNLKGITTITTLPIHLNTLVPLMAELLRNIGG